MDVQISAHHFITMSNYSISFIFPDAKEVDDLAGLKLDRLVKGSDVASQEQLEATVPVDLTKESDAQRVQLDEKVPLEAKAGTDAHATDVEKKAST